MPRPVHSSKARSTPRTATLVRPPGRLHRVRRAQGPEHLERLELRCHFRQTERWNILREHLEHGYFRACCSLAWLSICYLFHDPVAPMDVLVTVMHIEFFDAAGDAGSDGLGPSGVVINAAEGFDGQCWAWLVAASLQGYRKGRCCWWAAAGYGGRQWFCWPLLRCILFSRGPCRRWGSCLDDVRRPGGAWQV